MSGVLGAKRVLITGATGGLGQAVVRAFLREGAMVAGVARRWPENERQDGLLTVQADLGTPEGAEKAVRALVERHAGIDAAVHLMGGFAMDGPVESTKVETWDRMMEINARSAFLLFRAALPWILKVGRRAAAGSGFARGGGGRAGRGGLRGIESGAACAGAEPGGGAAAEGDHGECRVARDH